MKVTLCGVAMSAFASSITATVLILDEQTLLAVRTACGDVAGVIGETIASAAGPLPWVLRWRSGCRRR